MPGVYTGHTGGGVEYDTERTGGDRLNASVRNLQSPRRALRLLKGLWDPDGAAGCRLTATTAFTARLPLCQMRL